MPDLAFEWCQDDGKTVKVRPAELSDLEGLRSLYYETYGDRYALPEVVDDERSREVISRHGWVWLLAECDEKIVGSLIFGWDNEHRLGKSFAGVVDTNFRGQKTMHRMLVEGLRRLLFEGEVFDMVYAVVRTFVTPAFHRDLLELGFQDVGVFPNVRKVRRYETHGLKICMAPRALERRRKQPHLIPQIRSLYDIVADRFELESPLMDTGAVAEVRSAMDMGVELAPTTFWSNENS